MLFTIWMCVMGIACDVKAIRQEIVKSEYDGEVE